MYWTTRARQLTAVGLFMFATVGILVVRRGYSFSVIPPAADLDSVPRIVNDWKGEISEMSEGEIQVLGAEDSISLRLTNGVGGVAFLHIATWTDAIEIAETCPHHPEVCFAGNGWRPIQTQRVQWQTADGETVPVEISLMGRGEERLVVGFTYQMGRQRFCTDSAARLAQAKLWGQSRWPAVTKFMVQVGGRSIESALPTMQEILMANVKWFGQQDTQSTVDNLSNANS